MNQLSKAIAGSLIVGLFALDASGQDALRSRERGRRANTVIAVPHGERVLPTNGTRAAGPGLVYQMFADATSFFPQDPNTDERQAAQRVLEDMGLAPGTARELVSYTVQVHQRSSEGRVGFTAHLSLYDDDGAGAKSLPTDEIAGANCSIPDLHGLNRPDEGLAECIPNPSGESGIIIPDRTWLQVVFEGGCTGDLPLPDGCIDPGIALGPGWLLGPDGPEGVPTVGSTEPGFVWCKGDICSWLDEFGGGPPLKCEARASTPAPVPTVSEWGMVLIAMLVLTGGTIILRRSRTSLGSKGAAR